MTIFFDMDGTIADLYSVENWLDSLIARNPAPYAQAKPMCRFSALARLLNKAVALGYEVSVISWGSKMAPASYDEAVKKAKQQWLAKHLPSVHFSNIYVAHYGTPKSVFRTSSDDVLFDDEEKNREEWGDKSLPPSEIFNFLKNLE